MFMRGYIKPVLMIITYGLFTSGLMVTTNSLYAREQACEGFVPPPDEFDWMQLTSGEWLKGELKDLYNDQVEFDSDKLDDTNFDMEDVKQIRGHGIKGVRLQRPGASNNSNRDAPEPFTVYGELVVTEDKVIVTTAGVRQEYERSDLINIVSGKDRESQFWSAKISIGLNFTRGNTDEDDLSTSVDVRRRTSATRFVLDYLANYSRTTGVNTVDNNRLNIYFDIFKTRKYFLRPVFGEYFRDPFQNIDGRYTVGASIGYHIISTAKTEWDATAGAAYQGTQFISVEPGQDLKTSTPVLAISTLYETNLTRKIDFSFNYSFNIVNEESGSYTHHMITTVETELTSWLDFDISFVWDRVKNPTASADGTVPDPDDYRLTFSLGVDY
jgi:hypothetical protein